MESTIFTTNLPHFLTATPLSLYIALIICYRFWRVLGLCGFGPYIVFV